MSLPIRIAYFDLGISREEYGLQPTHYGGGGVAARYLKEDPEVDFHVFAPHAAFTNMGSGERFDRCHGLSAEVQEWLKAGGPLDAIVGLLDPSNPYDIILHGHTCLTLNRGTYRGPIVHWSGFDGKAGHPGNDYVLLYDDSFRPCFGERPKYVRIGKPVPPTYRPYPKAPYVFQCSRHDDHMASITTAEQCLRYGIQGWFAGPIHNGYPLLDHIDGTTTHYLGEITEPDKLAFMRHARLCCLPATWDLPFNQTVIEAQGQGCPIWVPRRGPFLSRYLRPGINGFDCTEVNLSIAYQLAARYEADMGRESWASAKAYDVSVMTASFKAAFREIVTEWAVRRA